MPNTKINICKINVCENMKMKITKKNNSQKITSLFILFALLSLLLPSNLYAVDYEEFMWEATTFIPERYKNEYWLEFYFLPNNPKYGFACSMNGDFAKTSDSGKTWHASTIRQGFHAESIHFADTNVGYVSGVGAIYKTTNGGNTWTPLTVRINGSPAFLSGSWGNYVIGENDVWLAQGDCWFGGRQIIYKSTNGGSTWTSFDTAVNNTHFTDLIMFERNGLGYAVSSGFLWRTLNGGIRWEIFNTTPIMNWRSGANRHNWHEDIAIYNNRSVLIPMSPGCNGGWSSGEGGLGFSSDLGRTWNTFITGGSMFGTFLLNDSTGWGCGYNNEVYYTKNYGRTWNLMNCGIPLATHLDDLWFINDTVGFVAGDGGIFRLVRRNQDIEITGDSLKCKHEFAELTVETEKDFTYYQWFEINENGDTILIAGGKNIVVADAGKYFVRGHILNCDYVQSAPFTVRDFTPPTIEIKSEGIFCTGDTVKIWVGNLAYVVNYEWVIKDTDLQNVRIDLDTIFIENLQANSFEILLAYEDLNGCNDTLRHEIYLHSRAKPLLVANGELSFCKNDTRIIRLVNANIFTENTWFRDNLAIANNISEYTVTESGEYFVIASVHQNCLDTSDILAVTVRDETDYLDFSENEIPFFIDSVNYGKQSSRYFKVKNIGDKPLTLNNIYFAKKFAFTVPVSQFPITLEPNESKNILIYYTPTNINEQFDTIYFRDNCTVREIPLSGFGKRNVDSAISICDIEIKATTHSVVQKKIFTVGSIVPNPVASKGKISYTVTTDLSENFIDNSDNSNVTVQIYDALGNMLSTQFVREVINIIRTEQNEIENGELIIDTQHLARGIYFLRINLENTNYLQTIIK